MDDQGPRTNASATLLRLGKDKKGKRFVGQQF